jgi:hypothetical protein
MRSLALISVLLAAGFLTAQEQKAPIASNPALEISGEITRVGLSPGEGMPSIDVKTPEGKTWKIRLGAMRYLVEQDFNPRAGQQAVVKGYKVADGEVVAATVTLPEAKKTIRLRDQNGYPLWRGRMGPPRGRMGPRGRKG